MTITLPPFGPGIGYYVYTELIINFFLIILILAMVGIKQPLLLQYSFFFVFFLDQKAEFKLFFELSTETELGNICGQYDL